MAGDNALGHEEARPASYGDVFREPEFRAIWGAQGLSLIGDWLAQVALAILVFERTGSALLSALTYALIFLPQLLGPFLAGLADMFPRRTVMVVSDIVRAVLVAIMAIPGMPFWALCVLLFCTHLMLAPFAAARAAILPDVLDGDKYVLGLSVTNITYQSAQVVGFVVGGAVVGLVGSRTALALDSVTFLISAVLLQAGVKARPAAKKEDDGTQQSGRPALLESTIAGARLIFGDRRLRALVAMAWLCAFYIVPEGLATPYAHTLDGTALTVGLIMAAMPLGTVAGALVIGRFISPQGRLRVMGPLAMLSCGPLIATALFPGLVVTLIILAVAGFASSYQLPANAAFVAAVPDSERGQAFGLVQGGIYAFQGLAIVVAGAAAELLTPPLVVALSGALGLAVAAWAASSWSRAPGPPASTRQTAGQT